jgi:hypothetical protein
MQSSVAETFDVGLTSDTPARDALMPASPTNWLTRALSLRPQKMPRAIELSSALCQCAANRR